jgi:polyisoprenoid-binding protein YceI
MRRIVWGIVYILAASGVCAQTTADIPIIKVSPVKSTITFAVKASVPIEGTFSSWDATLTFTSNHVEDGALDIKIQAASVNTGSRIKNDKLKGKDFFDASQDPYITFRSSKIVQTGRFTFDLPGTFTIRGVSKPETLTFTGQREGSTQAEIKGTMAFDRKEFGMDSGIPFIRIADRVEVNVDLNVDRVSGPPILFKQQP